MKVYAPRAALQGALGQIISVVPSRGLIPIYEMVKIETGEGYITLSGSDGDHMLIIKSSADTERPGALCTPARTLYELVRTLPDGPVTLERDGHKLVVQSGRSIASLPIGEAEDFRRPPTIDLEEAVEFDMADLNALIGKTLFAASDEQTRLILNGGLLHVKDNRIRAVATNGHLLASAYGPDAPASWPEEGVIVHRTGLGLIERIFKNYHGTVRVAASKDDIVVAGNYLTLYTRLIEGPYPNYEQVIPTEHPITATIDRKEFLGAVKRALVVAPKNSRRVHFHWEYDEVKLSAETSDLGSSNETVECALDGPGITIRFNGEYMAEVLSIIATDEVRIEMGQPERAAVITPVGDPAAMYVLMPLRLY